MCQYLIKEGVRSSYKDVKYALKRQIKENNNQLINYFKNLPIDIKKQVFYSDYPLPYFLL
jgi:hypothetical protein